MYRMDMAGPFPEPHTCASTKEAVEAPDLDEVSKEMRSLSLSVSDHNISHSNID